MIKSLRRAVVAAALVAPAAGVLVPVGTAVAAPTFTLSVTHGPPGTEITVTAEDCLTDAGDSFLQASLLSGAAPDERLAGVAVGFDTGQDATLVVPDWVDPDQPASVEARCVPFDDEGSPDPGSDGLTVTDYQPVAFDVEPGTGPSVQTRTFSRTSLLAGQGFRVTSDGCTVAGADGAQVVGVPGVDLSGRAALEGNFVTFGDGAVDGTSFSVDVLLSDASEGPNTLAPGTYTVLTTCGFFDGPGLVFEPQLIEVTGTAPTDAIALTVAPGTDQVTVAGSGCTAGPVLVDLRATSAAEVSDFGDTTTADEFNSQADEDATQTTVTPDAAGDWSFTDTAGFDDGIVEAFVECGDPFGDGFAYDPQVAAVSADEVDTPDGTVPDDSVPANPGPTTPQPGTPGPDGSGPGGTPSVPAPAVPLPGRPTFTG